LSKSGDTVQLGGALNKSTTIDLGANLLSISKTGVSSAVQLTNTNNSANELRFYEPSGSGAEYTSIKAGAQSVNIDYTLPQNPPATDGAVLTSTTGGQMSWSTTMLSGFKGKIACTGSFTQSITGLAGITAGSTVIVTLQDGASSGVIASRVTAITPGIGFTVEFAAPPPVTAFINYIVLP
ncbi:MAG: hypothetical protein LC116_06075, partial [Bacteroidetes bacterium]|nr:hypothetical protein [Bacteroidota bacterium]